LREIHPHSFAPIDEAVLRAGEVTPNKNESTFSQTMGSGQKFDSMGNAFKSFSMSTPGVKEAPTFQSTDGCNVVANEEFYDLNDDGF
jgi:hypothetical protein